MTAEPVHRTTARVVPVNPAGDVLLLYGVDPLCSQAPYWFTIGGGVEEGGTLVHAAVREMHEETGVHIVPDQLVGPFHRVERAHSLRGEPWVSESHFFAVGLYDVEVSFDGHQPGEAGFITDWRWWTPADLASTPLGLPQLPEIARAAVRVVEEVP